MFTSFVLLAAGESSRMGQSKQALPWEGITLLQYQVAQVAQTSASELIVALGHSAEACRRQAHITIPSHKGKHGHPPAFASSLFSEIVTISEEHRGLIEVIERDPTRAREVE